MKERKREYCSPCTKIVSKKKQKKGCKRKKSSSYSSSTNTRITKEQKHQRKSEKDNAVNIHVFICSMLLTDPKPIKEQDDTIVNTFQTMLCPICVRKKQFFQDVIPMGQSPGQSSTVESSSVVLPFIPHEYYAKKRDNLNNTSVIGHSTEGTNR